MTETAKQPSVEELKAACDQAREDIHAALLRAQAAKTLWREAIVEATGLVGHIVEGRKSRFVVTALASWSERYLTGPIIKADGTLGSRLGERAISEAVSLGKYEPPSSPAPKAKAGA